MPKKKTTRKRRVLSGLGKLSGCKTVSRTKGTKKGKGGRRVLRKGCSNIKGKSGKVRCCTPATKKRTSKKRTSKKKASSKKKVFTYSLNSRVPFYKKKIKGRRKLRAGCNIRGGKVVCKKNMSRKRAA